MESKFIIFLVFASLAYGSYIPELTITHGISKGQVATINRIIVKQEAAIAAYFEGFKTLFDIFYNLEAKSDDDTSKIRGAISGTKVVIDLAFDSLLIALGRSCSAAEVARKASYDYLQNATAEITAASKLAQLKKCAATRSAIEAHQVRAQKDFTKLVDTFYASMCTCLHIEDAYVLAVVKTAQDGSRLGLVHMSNAVFNAIKVLANVQHADKSFRYNIQDFENKALSGLMNAAEYKYSLLKTHVVYSTLNQRRILAELYSIQYALTASYNKYRVANHAIFSTVTRYLERIYLGLKDDGNLDQSRDNISSGTTAAYWIAGDAINLGAISDVHRDASAAITTARNIIFDIDRAGTAALYEAIDLARSQDANYTAVIRQIKTLRQGAIDAGLIYTGPYFDVIRNNGNFSYKLNAELTTLYERTLNGGVAGTVPFVDAIEVLANATHTGKVDKDVFAKISSFEDLSNFGSAEFGQGVAAGITLVLEAIGVS